MNKKHILSCVCIFVLMCALCFAGAASADTAVTSATTNWTTAGSPYTVTGSVPIGGRITVTGTVELILNDGCSLTAGSGINVTGDNSLTIRTPDGSKGDGKLVATGVGYYAGIGGNDGQNGGKLTIAGGWVTAVGGTIGGVRIGGGAGIGGAGSAGGRNGGVVTITGGVVDVTGGQNSAGIGGCANGSSGTITITGGLVKARGVEGGAGIGGGKGGIADSITITGGVVIAESESGAGIGGGLWGEGGLGGGGTLKSSSDGGAWIVTTRINSDISAFESGVLFNGTRGVVYGSPTVLTGLKASVPEGSTLTVTADCALTNEGILTVDGTLDLLGNIVNNYEIVLKDMETMSALAHGGHITGTGLIMVGGKYFTNGGFAVPTPKDEADDATVDKYVVKDAGLAVDRHRELLPELALEAIRESGLELDGSAAANTITPLKIVNVDVKGGELAVVIFDNISGRALVSGDEPVSADMLNIVKVTGKGRAIRLAPIDDEEANGTYAITRHEAPVRTVRADRDDYKLAVFIADDGELDLAKGVKGVVDPLVLVKASAKSQHDDPPVDPVSGDVVLKEDLVVTGTLTIAEGASLTVPNGIKLTVAEGGTLDNGGVIINRGTIDNRGTLINGAIITTASIAARGAAANGTIINEGVLINTGTLDTRGGSLVNTGTITNDGLVIVPSGTDIKALRMTGSGKVQMDGVLYDNDGNKLGPAPDPAPVPPAPDPDPVRASSGGCDASAGLFVAAALVALALRRRSR